MPAAVATPCTTNGTRTSRQHRQGHRVRPRGHQGRRRCHVRSPDILRGGVPRRLLGATGLQPGDISTQGLNSSATFDPLSGQGGDAHRCQPQRHHLHYDALARIKSISSPRATDPQPLVTYEYFLARRPPTAYAVAHHYDSFHPGDTIDTATFVDGTGRVVQTKHEHPCSRPRGSRRPPASSSAGRRSTTPSGAPGQRSTTRRSSTCHGHLRRHPTGRHRPAHRHGLRPVGLAQRDHRARQPGHRTSPTSTARSGPPVRSSTGPPRRPPTAARPSRTPTCATSCEPSRDVPAGAPAQLTTVQQRRHGPAAPGHRPDGLRHDATVMT